MASSVNSLKMFSSQNRNKFILTMFKYMPDCIHIYSIVSNTMMLSFTLSLSRMICQAYFTLQPFSMVTLFLI